MGVGGVCSTSAPRAQVATSACELQGWAPPFRARPGSRPRTVQALSTSVLPAVGPPLLIPVYFQYQIIMTMIARRDWVVSQGVQLAKGVGGTQGQVGPGACPVPPREGGLSCHSQERTSFEAPRN